MITVVTHRWQKNGLLDLKDRLRASRETLQEDEYARK